VAGSYASGTATTGLHLNTALSSGPIELSVGGVFKGNFSISGTLDYKGGGNQYTGTLAIGGSALRIAVSGPVGNGLMNYTFTAGSLKGDSGTVDISFAVLPNEVSEYYIDFDSLPHERVHHPHR